MYQDSRYNLSLTAANSASVTKSLNSQAGTGWDKTAVTNFVTSVPDQALWLPQFISKLFEVWRYFSVFFTDWCSAYSGM